MNTKSFLLLIFLLLGLVILSACAPEATPEELQEPPGAEELDPKSAIVEPQESPIPYPYPAPDEVVVDAGEPYPVPQEMIAEPDPYPGVEIVGNASDRDLSEAINPVDFVVQSGDEDLHNGPVFIDEMEIILKESDPVQVELLVVGSLPTPCHQLRAVSAEPDENGHIGIRAYSVSDPDMMCTQVLKPFLAVIPLGEYTEGTFTLSINDEIKREFTLP